MVSYILITGYNILLFLNPFNFKFLQVPAVLFYTFPTACRSEPCQRSLKIKNVWKIEKNVKQRDQNLKKMQKRFFTSMDSVTSLHAGSWREYERTHFYTFPTACRSELCQCSLKIKKNVWKIEKRQKT